MALTAHEPDDTALIRYLLGRASGEDTERFDELSIADEAFALRLRAVEHDLVDAYVRGGLTGDDLGAFKAQYLSTPAGLAAVDFAQALRARAPASTGPRVVRPQVAQWPWPRWALPAAAALLVATAALLFDNLRLRSQMAEVRSGQALVAERARQLEEVLRRHEAALSATEQELARAREALAAATSHTGVEPPRPAPGSLLALALVPAMRGGGAIPELTIPAGTTDVVLRLQLTALDFARYEVALRKAGGNAVLWRSGRLRPPAAAEKNALPVTVRASLLDAGAYVVELTGVPARGEAEPLDSYPFRVVR
jgi:hypothetical protein